MSGRRDIFYLKCFTLTEPVPEGFVFLPADWLEKYRKPLCEARIRGLPYNRAPALILVSGLSLHEKPL